MQNHVICFQIQLNTEEAVTSQTAYINLSRRHLRRLERDYQGSVSRIIDFFCTLRDGRCSSESVYSWHSNAVSAVLHVSELENCDYYHVN